jgi:hypothetical protein
MTKQRRSLRAVGWGILQATLAVAIAFPIAWFANWFMKKCFVPALLTIGFHRTLLFTGFLALLPLLSELKRRLSRPYAVLQTVAGIGIVFHEVKEFSSVSLVVVAMMFAIDGLGSLRLGSQEEKAVRLTSHDP